MSEYIQRKVAAARSRVVALKVEQVQDVLFKLMFLGVIAVAMFMLTGCGTFFGGMRKDLTDSYADTSAPTMGGLYAERGILAQEERASSRMPSRASAYGRGLASNGAEQARESGSWVGDEAAARRNRVRGALGDAETALSNTDNLMPSTKRFFKNGGRATRDDFVDDSINDGSLWGSDGQSNFYFSKNRTKNVGDILTIVAEPQLVKDFGAEMSRTLTSEERDIELEEAQKRLALQAQGGDSVKSSQAAATGVNPARSPASSDGAKTEVREATLNDIDLVPAIGFKENDTLMAEILERYPNGNYKIRGVKRVPYRGGYRTVTMLGIAKASDITDDDKLQSGKIYEYRLEAVR